MDCDAIIDDLLQLCSNYVPAIQLLEKPINTPILRL